MSKKVVQFEIPDDIQKMLDELPDTSEFIEELRRDIANFRKDPAWIADYLKMSIASDILAAMESQGVDRSELARRLGKSRQYVSRVLNERANFTLDSLAQIACALDMSITARIHSPENVAATVVKKTPKAVAAKATTVGAKSSARRERT